MGGQEKVSEKAEPRVVRSMKKKGKGGLDQEYIETTNQYRLKNKKELSCRSL